MTVQCPGQGIVRTSDVRVSERTPLTQIRQKPFGPIYNELAEDVRIMYTVIVHAGGHGLSNICDLIKPVF